MTFRLLIFALVAVSASQLSAQRPRFSDFFSLQQSPVAGTTTTPPQILQGIGQPLGGTFVGPTIAGPTIVGPTIAGPSFGSAPVFGGLPQFSSPGIGVSPPQGLIAPAFDPFQSNVQPLPFGGFGAQSPTFGTPGNFNRGILPSLGADRVPALPAPAPRNIQVLPPQIQPQSAPFPGFQNNPVAVPNTGFNTGARPSLFSLSLIHI